MKKMIIEYLNSKIVSLSIFVVSPYLGLAILIVLCVFYYVMRNQPKEIEYHPDGKIKKKVFRRFL